MANRGDLAQEGVGLAAQLGQIAEQLKALARVQDALRKLYMSVLGRDVGLEAVLRQIVLAAMDLVDARYGALGVLNEEGDELTEFVFAGLTREEEAAAAHLGLPRGRGALAHLMADPRPLRVDSISEHPLALRLCSALAEHHPGDGSDDIALLALQLPACPRSCSTVAVQHSIGGRQRTG
jgi:hypothetical protein